MDTVFHEKWKTNQYLLSSFYEKVIFFYVDYLFQSIIVKINFPILFSIYHLS